MAIILSPSGVTERTRADGCFVYRLPNIPFNSLNVVSVAPGRATKIISYNGIFVKTLHIFKMQKAADELDKELSHYGSDIESL